MTKSICAECSSFILSEKAKAAEFTGEYHRNHMPANSIEGDPDSEIWIIGLNPKNEIEISDRTCDQLRDIFIERENIPGYFKDFRKVSPLIYANLGIKGGVAHTDLVKCSSTNFDFPEKIQVVNQCVPYLKEQLEAHNPKMIICNGAEVSKFIKAHFVPPECFRNGFDTSYEYECSGNKVIIILSGFIGRIDDYSKRRLGIEIEMLLSQANIVLPEPMTIEGC